MSRDYARRNFTRKKSKKSSKSRWLMIFLLFITFAAGLVILNKNPKFISYLKITNPTTEEKKSPTLKSQPLPETVTKTISAPKFDFYNTLPTKKIDKNEEEYELEIAIVKNFAAADRLKAELSLLGFTVNISPIHNLGNQKYYVSVGPYTNKDEANIDQQKLQQNKIKSTIKKLH